ncbi:SagB family peptide dehydrogenase [Lentzea sp. NPDC006480]|uniref:SagB family peptide dehydrogenase n=1 Tax=Lentzea sp. NPDC006480 TaxID=3157176 RepID=UPI00339DE8B6
MLNETTTRDLILSQARFRLALPDLDLGMRTLLSRLADGWLTDVDVVQLATRFGSEREALASQLMIMRLHQRGWLDRRLSYGGGLVLDSSSRAIGAAPLKPAYEQPIGAGYRLSRFAIMRADEGNLLLHSPLGTSQITFHRPELAACLALAAAQACTADDIAKHVDVDEVTGRLVLSALADARVLVTEGEFEQERSTAPMAFWSPEEAWLHERSRSLTNAAPVGGTYRFRGVIEPPQPEHQLYADAPAIALPPPTPAETGSELASLDEVMARRRSLRIQDHANPISIEQLGALLHRAQRLRPHSDGSGALKRPYPGAGALGELEIYPVVYRCAGLVPGLYHYDSVEHRLELVAADGTDTKKLLSYARATCQMSTPPQVLLVITARLPRLMWKYEGIPYALGLKNAGVLTAWLYLIATGMGLAPCALGAGDTAGFAALSGLDPFVEPSIAEFAIGSQLSEERS